MINDVYGRNVRNTDGSSKLYPLSEFFPHSTMDILTRYSITFLRNLLFCHYIPIHLLNKYSLNAYYVLDTVLGTRQ